MRRPLVSTEIGSGSKILPAVLAHILATTEMHIRIVVVPGRWVSEGLAASLDWTHVTISTRVPALVHTQVGYVGEAFSASRLRAEQGLLARVGSAMRNQV